MHKLASKSNFVKIGSKDKKELKSMQFSRNSNLKELSVAEIDDLIKEKSCTLKYTEEKLSKGEMTNSTHRRRENMNSNNPCINIIRSDDDT